MSHYYSRKVAILKSVENQMVRKPFAAVLSIAAIVLLSLAAFAATTLLPREVVVPLSEVTKYFPDVTTEAGTGENETKIGSPAASLSVVFTSPDGTKKVTLSVDQYASAEEATEAFNTAVEGSKVAPGFKPADAPNLGEAAFAGTSQVGEEEHFGLGARDGRLIISATHAGAIPVTPENTKNLIELSTVELETARQALGN